ncbi:hypothetical protein BV129_00913B, partial [Haemophilus influenzae]
FR